MADTAPAALLPQPTPVPPAADQPKNTSEMKEDVNKPEKWPFSEPQPIREDQVRNAVNFLSHPKVRGTPMVQRYSFLERKGLSREEIEEAFKRCPDPPTSEASKTVPSSEAKVPALPPQAPSGHYNQAVVSAQSQPANQYLSVPMSAIVPARRGTNWSQLIVGAGLIAAAGAGTGYFFQKVLAPKLRMWLHRMLDEEKKAAEKQDGQGKGVKATPLEEAVTAAAAAANAAATAAAEVANISREVLKLQAEEWQHVKSLMKTLDTKTEELKSTLTLMRKTSQDAEEHVVPHGHAEDTNYYKGTAKPHQRIPSPPEQLQMRPGSGQMFQSMNGGDRIQTNGHSTSFNSFVSQSEDEPWWRRKKVEVETYTSPKQQHVEIANQVSELEANLDQEIGNTTSSWASTQNRGGPLGRQGWMPPAAPQAAMPGAASAIRYRKPATIDEARHTVTSEEKVVDSRQPPPSLQSGYLDSTSSMQLQNPVRFNETKPKVVIEDLARLKDEGKPNGITEKEMASIHSENSVSFDEINTRVVAEDTARRLHESKLNIVAEEKEMATQSPFELPTMPQAEEITKVTSIEEEIRTSLQNPVKVAEAIANFVAEQKDMTSQTAFERREGMSEVSEIVSEDKGVRTSSVEDWTADSTR